jgi:L-lysine 2,3-aminomutase
MIKSINSGSQYITVSGGIPSTPSFSPGAISAGLVRYNTNLQQMEVYDGMSWYGISNHVTVDLGMTSKEAVEWAHKKMLEEKRLQDLMNQHPGLRELNDKFEMMKALCMEEEKQ